NSKQKAQSAANNHACMSGSSTKISLPMPSDLLPTGIPPMYDIFGSVISPAKIDYLRPPSMPISVHKYSLGMYKVAD
ncbi:hypothetical protein ACN38_g12916, partial [Penicillium nordicum]